MDLLAKIKGIKYTPCLNRDLEIFDIKDLEHALSSNASFILRTEKDKQIAMSWWVSPKRTRSYPYARIYDTLSFSGKKVTVIPVVKDEGLDGDRDFLQWDTIFLMSLLGVYVIIAYYINAEKSKRYKNKITKQRFDINYINRQIRKILSYQSDALHWNLEQIDNIGRIGKKALNAYTKISDDLKVEMHSWKSADKRIKLLLDDKNEFMTFSRTLAEKAQSREQMTMQPKEQVNGTKAKITIQNYLGGYYYLTSDETEIKNNDIFLIECKHSKNNSLPSLEDIKDGLVKMILFTNLEDLKIGNKNYRPIAMLKLTVKNNFNENNLSDSQKNILSLLQIEAKKNNFKLNLL